MWCVLYEREYSICGFVWLWLTTSEWPTIKLHTKVRLISETWLCDAYIRKLPRLSLVQIIACCLLSTKPSSKLLLACAQILTYQELISMKFSSKLKCSNSQNAFEMSSTKKQPFCLNLNMMVIFDKQWIYFDLFTTWFILVSCQVMAPVSVKHFLKIWLKLTFVTNILNVGFVHWTELYIS